jgi:hypothetical protein
MLTGQAAGALAAIAVSQNLQPRQVSPGMVQRTLLDFHVGLAKQELSDLPRNGEEWKAAQYALVHGWIVAASQGYSPLQAMTRAQAADALASAFGLLPSAGMFERRWGYQITSEATFKDVPLYSKHSPGVEALAAAQALLPCAKASNVFCPEEIETVADFLDSLRILDRLSQDQAAITAGRPSIGESNRAASINRSEQQSQAPLTRIKAAEILYHNLEPAVQSSRP